jgi:2-keto-4-pentenoate hydratase/2-oxohepta-3-ene-1,7-dioic acid hydratase in catechol pathway
VQVRSGDEAGDEAELATIIGRGGRGIPREQALEHVWGYPIINDVTARDV